MRNVVVHSVGKVASSAITGLAASALNAQVPHTHQLVRQRLEHNLARCAATGSLPSPHIIRSFLVLEWLDAGEAIDFITVVREPFARNLSAFFQNINLFMDDPTEATAEDIATAYMEDFPHQRSLEWFDRQVRDPLGIDVFTHEFDTSEGFATIEGDQHRMLILRRESSTAKKRQLVGDFLGVPMPELMRVNTTSAKETGTQYAAVKEQLQLPAEFVEEVFDSRYCRHFFSAAERDLMWARWVEGSPSGF